MDIHNEVLEKSKTHYPKKKEAIGPTMGQVDQKLAAEKKKILDEARKIAKGAGKNRSPRFERSRTPPPRRGDKGGGKDRGKYEHCTRTAQ